MKPSAKIICDSVSQSGVRLTTMEVKMHRYVLAEFNTHRMFSRNSASSRAIPVKRTLEMVKAAPAMPLHWGSNQPGMQAGDQLQWGAKKNARNAIWRHKLEAIKLVKELEKIGLHKQVANRYIEPYLWHTVIVTATEWDNFFHLRCHPDAQPEMKAAADEMQLAYYRSTPQLVANSLWHLPYVDNDDIKLITNWYLENPDAGSGDWDDDSLEVMKRISVARCARVSYLTHDGKRDIDKDISLYTRLVEGNHMSPFEHVATPMTDGDGWSGNFRGWYQLRKTMPNDDLGPFIPNHPELVDKEVTDAEGS